MQRLVQGIRRFLDARLSHGKSPETLLITCSDFSTNADLHPPTRSGDRFVMPNAAEIVPPAAGGGEGGEASLGFAVAGCGVKEGQFFPSTSTDVAATPESGRRFGTAV